MGITGNILEEIDVTSSSYTLLSGIRADQSGSYLKEIVYDVALITSEGSL